MLIAREKPKLLPIAIPMYNEVEVFPVLAAELTRAVRSLPCPVEVILVDDDSADATYQLMRE